MEFNSGFKGLSVWAAYFYWFRDSWKRELNCNSRVL